MAVYSAREIYRFARLAGFSPDQATTMTAIALAESGGDSRAHATSGEDSRGLWQINVPQHGEWAARKDMYDPVENARAALRISGSGTDVSPWTTTHGGARAKYLSFRAEAEAAARACGDGAGLGVWTGTAGYHHPLAAGHTGGGAAFEAAVTGGGGGGVHAFLDAALAQAGDQYVFGASARGSDPTSFDCSELVRWSASRAGVELPRRAFDQYMQLQQQGSTISVEEALRTPGALLFSFKTPPPAKGSGDAEHVAISLGDGRTIEARGKQWGVGSWSAQGRFGYAAVIPGIAGGSGSTATAALTAAAVGTGSGLDGDGDGLTDALELKMGLDGKAVDSDGDGLSDGYELLQLHTDPTKGDTDGDGVGDSIELALGTDSSDPDSDRDGRLDGSDSRPGGGTDTDGDGLTDELEKILNTDAAKLDSDGDGFTDGAEYQAFFDPASPTNNPLAGPGTSAALPPTQPPAPAPDPHSWGLDDHPLSS